MSAINTVVARHEEVIPSAAVASQWMSKFSLSTADVDEIAHYVKDFVDVVKSGFEIGRVKKHQFRASPMLFRRMAACYKKFAPDDGTSYLQGRGAIQRRMKRFEKIINLVFEYPLSRNRIKPIDYFFCRLKMFEIVVDVWAEARQTHNVFQWKELAMNAIDQEMDAHK